MTKRNTKNALISSVLALILCFSMLLGTTFAWFTDSVESATNIIAAGNLDIELYHTNSADNRENVSGDTKLFDDVTPSLWEPGAMAYEQFEVANEGTLALKYQFALNVANATVINGVSFAQMLKVAVVEEGFVYTRANVEAIEEWQTLSTFTLSGNLEAKKNDVFGVVIWWQPNENDNVFNMNNENKGKTVSVEVGVTLKAAQLMSEEDSFGNSYDGGTEWYGTVDYSWYNTTDTELTISSAEQLAGLAAIVNGTAKDIAIDSFAGKTITLGSNINLNNLEWTPIGSAYADHGFMGNFDGNGKTISNLYIGNIKTDADGYAYAGLFGVTEGEKDNENYIKDLTIENVTINTTGHITAAAIAYPYYTTLENITVCGDIAIKGGDYTSGALAYTRRCTTASNVTVAGNAGSYITGTQVVGGVISDIQMNGGLTANYSNFSASNVTITGTKMVGGISGIISRQTLNGATVKNVTILCPDARVGIVSGSYDSTPVINNVTFSNVTGATSIAGAPYSGDSNGSVIVDGVEHLTVISSDELNTALANGITNIRLAGGDYTLPSLSGKSGITIIGSDDGSTKLAGVNSFNFGEDTVIKNVTFKTTGSNSVRYGTTSGDVVYENCVFEGKQYGYHVDNANGGTITFNNCTFYGRNALAANGTYTFNNCTFKYTYGNYNTTNIYSEATFNNCYWDSKGISLLELYIEDGAKAIIDGDEITERVVFIANARALESFQQSVNWKNETYAGVTVMLSADIDMNDAYYANWTPIGQTGATQFMGTFDGHGYTIKNLKIDTSKQTGANYSTGLFGWLNKATVKNLTIDTATVTGNHNVGVIAGYMETAGCTISNCHVINATVVAKHANDDACGDKVGVIVGHAGNAGVLVENCTATNSTVTAGRDAGQITGAAKAANVVDCSATGVTVTASGECTGANVNETVIGRVL